MAKRNYKIHEKELLPVIQVLEEWRHILEGIMHMREILNDHWKIMYFHTSQNLNYWQVHWSLFLSRFDFSLIHRPGRHSAKPDTLSHWVDHQAEEDEDNCNEVMLSAESFHGLVELSEFLAGNRDGPLGATL